MKKFLAAVLVLCVGISLCVYGTPASAFEATGTVNLIVSFAPGGAMDIGARLFAKYASEYTSANIVISNISGAGGIIGTAEVLKFGADGSYMLTLNPSLTFVSTPDRNVPFDITKDFVFCAMMVRDPRLLAIRKDDSRFSNTEEFIEYSRANPGVTVGTSGIGTVAHYTPYLISRELDLNLVPVAFDGTGELRSALLGGHVDAASLGGSESVSMLANDQIIVILNAAAERSTDPLFADVPTVLEYGADVQLSTSRGFAFRAGTDESVIAYWSDIFEKVTSNPAFLAEADALGLPIYFMDYKAANEFVAAEMELFRELIATIN